MEPVASALRAAPWGDDAAGDGSAQWPFRTIQHTADEAGDHGGGLVAVAAGTYRENLELDARHDAVEIRGRCRERVVLDGSDRLISGLRVAGGRVSLSGLAVSGGDVGIDVAGGTAVLDRVVLTANSLAGLWVHGGTAIVEVNDFRVDNMLPDGQGNWGRAISVEHGGRFQARGMFLDANLEVGLFAGGSGTTVTLRDATIQDTNPDGAGDGGRGISVEDGASLFADGLVVRSNHDAGIFVASEGTSVELHNAVVRETRPDTSGLRGMGIDLHGGARLVASDLLIEANHSIGLRINGAGTVAEVVGVDVRDTHCARPPARCSAGASLSSKEHFSSPRT